MAVQQFGFSQIWMVMQVTHYNLIFFTQISLPGIITFILTLLVLGFLLLYSGHWFIDVLPLLNIVAQSGFL